MAVIQQVVVMPAGQRRAEAVDHLQVILLVAVGLGFGNGGFAEQVQGGVHALVAQSADAGQGMVQLAAAHEFARQAAQRVAHRGCGYARGPGGAAVFQAPFGKLRQIDVAKIFLQVARQHAIVVQCRQHVDEAQRLDTKIVIDNGARHEHVDPGVV